MHRTLTTFGLAFIITTTAGCFAAPYDREEEGSSKSEIIGNTDHARRVFQYFAGTYGEVRAAAIVGNLQVESYDEINPAQNQDGGGPGRGIAQWGATVRWVELQNWARQNHKDPMTFDTQLEYIGWELAHHGAQYHVAEFRAADDIRHATELFMRWYENPRPADQHFDRRLAHARAALANYGTHHAPSSSSSSAPPSSSGGGSPMAAPDDSTGGSTSDKPTDTSGSDTSGGDDTTSTDDGSGSDDGSSSGKPQ